MFVALSVTVVESRRMYSSGEGSIMSGGSRQVRLHFQPVLQSWPEKRGSRLLQLRLRNTASSMDCLLVSLSAVMLSVAEPVLD